MVGIDAGCRAGDAPCPAALGPTLIAVGVVGAVGSAIVRPLWLRVLGHRGEEHGVGAVQVWPQLHVRAGT